MAIPPEIPGCTRTRSGRISKVPERYEPKEKVLDDYTDGDYDSDENIESCASIDDDEEDDEDDEEDADEYGNLDGFVVPDDEDDCASSTVKKEN
jgi:hypothetical protein